MQAEDLPPGTGKEDWQGIGAAGAINILSNPIMVADADLVIRYVNKAALEMFSAIESDIQRDLPQFSADDVLGKPIDFFHKNPAHQRGIIARMTSVYDGSFEIGGKALKFKATPVFGEDGAIKNIYVEWQDVTAFNRSQRQIDLLIEQVGWMSDEHAKGNISSLIDTPELEGRYAGVANGVNRMVQDHIDTKRKIIACMKAFAKGDLAYEMERFAGERGFVNEAIDDIKASFNEVIGEIEAMSNAIIEGDLDRPIQADKFEGSYRDIVESFGRAYDNLNEVMTEINGQVGEITMTISQLNRSAQSLSENSQSQSAAIEEISASVEETNAMVQTNAEATEEAQQLVSTASHIAADGKDKMRNMVSAMSDIRTSSEDISKIIKVIDEIAFQTNLLALNAAVEAARAGSHGRGFAVVAQEVRNLAGRSAKAARETSDLIEGAVQRVGAGSKLADETQVAFENIAQDVDKIDQQTGSIAASSNEQSRGINQISIALGELTNNSAETTGQSEELAAAANQMEASTNVIKGIMARFKLRQAAQGGGSGLRANENVAALMKQLKDATEAGGVDAGLSEQIAKFMSGDHDARGFGDF
ncbi:methyl-accepting chemotaxis protein [Thalassovita mangrovi]|uniref:PAS domain-containing protein n=1 Tax=Thalassovita mangrovi TaxID=2692236 RepID=A0A6L8LLY2_9RHOB|nr:methyl-accepting chemotaxis protein [Thalassovita mangrovi]MYM56885.1 PAS domain-containing protein [Thalassovita mangrovi]